MQNKESNQKRYHYNPRINNKEYLKTITNQKGYQI